MGLGLGLEHCLLAVSEVRQLIVAVYHLVRGRGRIRAGVRVRVRARVRVRLRLRLRLRVRGERSSWSP